MQIEGWDISIAPHQTYETTWAAFLGKKPLRARRDWVPIADRIIKEQGQLDYKWLRSNGYEALYLCMKRFPELFTHITPANLYSPLAQRVQQARDLAAANGGRLPRVAFLLKHHPAIRSAMRDHPEAFHEFVQERGRPVNHTI